MLYYSFKDVNMTHDMYCECVNDENSCWPHDLKFANPLKQTKVFVDHSIWAVSLIWFWLHINASACWAPYQSHKRII